MIADYGKKRFAMFGRCAVLGRPKFWGTRPERARRPQEFGSALAGGAGAAAAHPGDRAGPAAARGSRCHLSAAAASLSQNETNSRISRENGENAAAFFLRRSVGTVTRPRRLHRRISNDRKQRTPTLCRPAENGARVVHWRRNARSLRLWPGRASVARSTDP